jgi:hypothetical protein
MGQPLKLFERTSLINFLGGLALCIPLAVVSCGASCVPPPDGIVSWWRAEGDGSDWMGTNQATLLNGVGFANGMVGEAFNFDGVNDAIVVSNSSSVNFGPGQDFSIEAWVRPLASTTDFGVMSVVDKRFAPNTTQCQGYEFNLTGGRVHCRLSDSAVNNGTEFGPAGPDLRDGNLHHIALSVARTSTTGGCLCVDGQVVLTFNPTVEPGDLGNTQPLRIGHHASASVFAFFKGQIDELSLYSRALTTNEIAAIYAAGSAGKCLVSGTAPGITNQPQNQTVAAGSSATFTVTAGGSLPLSYQWQKATDDIPGATNSSYTISSAHLGDGGVYSVKVWNPYGFILSSNALLTVTPPTTCVSIPSGAISWWRSELNGSDAVGNNPGVLLNGIGFTNGMVNQAFSFDGLDDRIIVSNAPSLNFGHGQDFSIEAWILPLPSVTSYDVMSIVDKRFSPDTTHCQGYEFNLISGRIHCRLSDSTIDNGSEFGPVGPDLRDGNFHHVALTVSRAASDGGRLFVDGNVVLTFDPTGEPGDLSNNEPFWIGNHASDSVFAFFKGQIDEVTLYGRALSSDEIQTIHDAGSLGKCPPPGVLELLPLPGAVQIGFSGIPGQVYRLQRATNIFGPWIDAGSTATAPNGLGTILDSVPPQDRAFYRTIYP